MSEKHTVSVSLIKKLSFQSDFNEFVFLLCMFEQNLCIWRPKTGGAIIRAGAIIIMNTVFRTGSINAVLHILGPIWEQLY